VAAGVALLALLVVALLAGPGVPGLLAFALAGSLIVAIAWAGTRQVVAPLRRLLQATEQVTAGDFTVRAQAENTVEMDELAAGFNALVITLEAQRHELVSALDAGATALGHAEAELAHRREAARVKDEFIATISEELRAPLRTMRGFLELVLGGDALSAEQRRFVTASLRNSEGLLRVVEDLLLIARIEAGELELERGEVDVLDVAAEAVEQARAAGDEEGVSVALDTRGLPIVNGDRARIAQLLRNLISQAIGASPRGGRVDVVAEAAPRSAVLTVTHTGTAPAQQHGPFFGTARVDRARVMAEGLALPVARGIAAAHGGSVAVAGTVVRVELPA
jgi:signal transduction histidine kinase